MAISFIIGWAIFSPFAVIEDLKVWSFSKIQTSDLFAIFLPTGFLLALANWITPLAKLPVIALSAIAVTILLFSASALFTGLFLLAKMEKKPPLKRITLIGAVIPLGALLSLIWIMFPVYAFASSIFYAMAATLAVAPITMALRLLSSWLCKSQSPAQ